MRNKSRSRCLAMSVRDNDLSMPRFGGRYEVEALTS
jgi:hypothetical protein